MLGELFGALFGNKLPGADLDPSKPVAEQMKAKMTAEIQEEVTHGTVLIDTLIAKGIVTEAELDAQMEIEKERIAQTVEEKFATDPRVKSMVAELQQVIDNKNNGLCGCGKPLGHDEDEDGEQEEGTPVDEAAVTQEKIMH